MSDDERLDFCICGDCDSCRETNKDGGESSLEPAGVIVNPDKENGPKKLMWPERVNPKSLVGDNVGKPVELLVSVQSLLDRLEKLRDENPSNCKYCWEKLQSELEALNGEPG